MKTLLLCTLLLIFTTTLPRAAADEWISEQYRCVLTIPTQESWARGLLQPLPKGEVIFHAASMTTNQGVMLTYVEEMPSGDLKNPALVKRITEVLETQGWKTESSSPLTWQGRASVQFITQRRDFAQGRQIGIARALMRGKSLYLITAYGKGEASRADDPEFMRVVDTFRFVEQALPSRTGSEMTSPALHKFAMIGAAGAAAMLIVAYAFLTLLWMRREKERA